MTPVHGQCHCANLRFTFTRPASVAALTLRACGCDFCARHGARWTSHPDGTVELQVAHSGDVTRYRFGTESAEFLACARCGVLVIARCHIEGRDYAVVNGNTFEGVALDQIDCVATDFEGEALAARLARRQRNWSPLLTSLP